MSAGLVPYPEPQAIEAKGGDGGDKDRLRKTGGWERGEAGGREMGEGG